MTDYAEIARQWAGPGNEDAVRLIAEHLHANESLHMHDNVGSRKPCSYCWLRAAKSLQALQRGGFAVARAEPDAAAEETEQEADEATYPEPGDAIPDMPGYVVGECGHRVAGSEWRAGFKTCERCPSSADREEADR